MVKADKKIIFSFGRFNPPTIGHAKVLNYILDLAYYSDADHMVVVSKTFSKKKNPLDIFTKMKYLNLFFPEINFVAATKKSPDFIAHLKNICNDGYNHVTMICGEDRVKEYTRIVNLYNGKDFTFDTIQVKSAGTRSEGGLGVHGSSATKMREAALRDDMGTFIDMCPTNQIKLAQALYYEVRHGLGLKTQEFSFYK